MYRVELTQEHTMPNTPEFEIPEHLQIDGVPGRESVTVMESNRSPVFDVRDLGWERISTPVENNVERALTTAHLNWTVLPRPVTVDGCVVPGRFANVRSDLPPGSNVLEIVGSKYQIIQNKDGLYFVQNIIDNGLVTLENAGTFDEGRSVFLLAKTEGLHIGGEHIAPYIVFSNSHDGSGKVKAALTTMRVICKNTLALALKTAPRVWAITHTKSAIDHMKAASQSMNFIGNYLTAYPAYVEHLMETEVTDAQFADITKRLYPVPEANGHNATSVRNAQDERAIFEAVYNETPDLRRWHGTVYGVVGAYTDVISHRTPRRTTQTFEENRFATNMVSGRDTERAQGIIMAVVNRATA